MTDPKEIREMARKALDQGHALTECAGSAALTAGAMRLVEAAIHFGTAEIAERLDLLLAKENCS